jgi:HEAT repeat protein
MQSISDIGIFTTDAFLKITSWNDWLQTATGMKEESVLGKPLALVIPDIDKRGFKERFLKVLTDGVVEVLSPLFHHYLIRIPLDEPTGKFREMQQRVTISPLTEEDHISGLLVTIEDITAGLAGGRTEAYSSDIQELSSESWSRRRDVAGSLAHAGKAIISEVLRKIRLEHSNPSVLSSAMRVISMSNEDVTDILTEFLHDKDKDLRIYAAQMLGEKNSTSVVEALIGALDDPNPNVRYQAIESLGRLKAFQAVEKLSEIALDRDFFTSFPAIDALKAIGDVRASRLILQLIDDEMLAEPVIEALAELGEAEIVPPVIERINSQSGKIIQLVKALGRIAERYDEVLGDSAYIADLVAENISNEGLRNLVKSLETATADDLNSLITVLGWIDTSESRIALTRYLGHNGARKVVIEAFVTSGQKVVDLLISQLVGEPEVKQSAVTALGRIGDPRATEALLPLLKDDEMAVICCSAIAKIGDRRAFNDLLELLGHENPAIRRAAIAALNSIGHPEMARKVASMLSNENPYVRESALRIAGYFGFPECRIFVHRLISDIDQDVRVAAIESLPFFEDERMISALKCLGDETDPKIRVAVVKSLGQMSSKQSLPLLKKALDDPDEWVRYYALKSIDNHGYLDILYKIREIAVNDSAPFVRTAAVEYLGHIGGQTSVSILSTLADDVNRDVALTAVNSLGDIHHPDAYHPLLALSRSPDRDLRKAAVEAIGRRGGKGSPDILQWVALTEKDHEIRSSAMRGLRMIANPESVKALLNITADASNREKAICMLSTLPSEKIGMVREGLGHKNIMVRTAVVEILLRNHTPEASEILAGCLSHSDQNVRLAAIYALHRLGNRKYMKKLIGLKNYDPDPVVRKAIEELIMAGPPE